MHECMMNENPSKLPDIAKEVGGGQREGDDDEDDPLEVEPGERHQEEHRPQRGCQDQTAPKDAHLSTSG